MSARKGISAFAEEDGLRVERVVVRRGLMWALGRLEGDWRAYPEHNHALTTGVICLVAADLPTVLKWIREESP